MANVDVRINSRTIQYPEGTCIKQILSESGVGRSVVVIVNGISLLQKQFACYNLKADDVVHIIKPLTGG